MEIWQTLLLAFGGNAVLLAILGWLAKSFVSGLIAKDLKGFENDLKLKAIEHQTKFTGLHEKRADVLASFYRAVITFEMYFKEHGHPINQKLTSNENYQHSKEIASRFNHMEKIFIENRVFFTLETCKIVDNLLETLEEIRKLNKTIQVGLTTGGTTQAIRIPSYQGIKDKIAPIKLEVENNFRNILGIDIES
jgi:hypothetical protein